MKTPHFQYRRRAEVAHPPFARPGDTSSSILEVDSTANLTGDDIRDDEIQSSSLTASVTDYHFENGRRYHAYKAGHYPFPNDEAEMDRLDMQHHVSLLLFNGKLHYAPLQNPSKVLDIGTGTGLWAIEFADLFPKAKVVGTDLSPTQPSLVPDNVVFEVADVETDWLMKHESFDYIHSRFMLGALTSYRETFLEAFKHLKPGGYLEVQEIDPVVNSDDGTHQNSKWHCQFFCELRDASEKYGKYIPRHWEYKALMEEAGFVDVEERYIKCPIGTWPKNPRLKEVGRFQYLHYNEGYEALSVGLFTRVLGWQAAEIQVLLAKVRAELRDSRMHTYQAFAVLVGRKPHPSETRPKSPVADSGSRPLGSMAIPQFDSSLVDRVRESMPAKYLGAPSIEVDTESATERPSASSLLEADHAHGTLNPGSTAHKSGAASGTMGPPPVPPQRTMSR